MTGNSKKEFGFKMICNGNAKWVIRTTNVYEDYLYSMITFNDEYTDHLGKDDKFYIKRLMAEDSYKNVRIEGDTVRDLNIKEYNKLGRILKMFNIRYNKKKDEFIEIDGSK